MSGPVQGSLGLARPKGVTIQEEFEWFDRANPEVYKLFKRFALAAKRSGRARFGAKAIVERIRWEYALRTDHPEFKMPNNFTARYVRKLIADMPEFEGFFQLAQLRTP